MGREPKRALHGAGEDQHWRGALRDCPALHAYAGGQHSGCHVQQQAQGGNGRGGVCVCMRAALVLCVGYPGPVCCGGEWSSLVSGVRKMRKGGEARMVSFVALSV